MVVDSYYELSRDLKEKISLNDILCQLRCKALYIHRGTDVGLDSGDTGGGGGGGGGGAGDGDGTGYWLKVEQSEQLEGGESVEAQLLW